MAPTRLLAVLAVLGATLAHANVVLILQPQNLTYVDRAALFGPRLNASGLVGLLVPMRDFGNEQACFSNSSGPNFPSDVPWVALVQRDSCSYFADKVRGRRRASARQGRPHPHATRSPAPPLPRYGTCRRWAPRR